MILLVSANWPQRALIRAQLAADTGHRVVGAESVEQAVQWLRAAPFALVVVDTQGLLPDARLVETLKAQRMPLILITTRLDDASWRASPDLNICATLVRPIFIGDIARAARQALVAGTAAGP